VKLPVKSLDVAVAGPVERAWELRLRRRLCQAGLRLRRRGRWRRLGAGGDGVGCLAGSVDAAGSTLSDGLQGVTEGRSLQIQMGWVKDGRAWLRAAPLGVHQS
jgi:hypothetical protein